PLPHSIAEPAGLSRQPPRPASVPSERQPSRRARRFQRNPRCLRTFEHPCPTRVCSRGAYSIATTEDGMTGVSSRVWLLLAGLSGCDLLWCAALRMGLSHWWPLATASLALLGLTLGCRLSRSEER